MTFVILAAAACMGLALLVSARPEPRRIPVRTRDREQPRR